MDHVFAVPENLHFDMATGRHIALKIDPCIAKCGLRFGHRKFDSLNQFVRRMDQFHAAPATACDRLDQNRPTHFGCQFLCLDGGRSLSPGDHRQSSCERMGPGLQFVAHRIELRLGRADEDHAGQGAGLRELLVLGQEAIARMNCVRLGCHGSGDHSVYIQVTEGRFGRADANGLIRHAGRQ